MLNRILHIVMILMYCLIFFGAGFAIGQNDKLANQIIYNLRMFAFSLIDLEKASSMDKTITVWNDNKEKSHDGLILIGSFFINNPAIVLTNKEGKILHKWNVEKKVFNQETVNKHGDHGKDESETVHGIDDAELLPDGSVIFSQSIYEFANYRAQRVAKIDKNSKLIWQLIGVWHHDLIIAEDENIYLVGSELSKTSAYIDQDKSKNSSFLRGIVSIVSPDGKLLKTISVEDAFLKSEYKNMLSLFTLDIDEVQEVILKDDTKLYDPIHLNSVDYITAKQAEKIPFAKEGDLLISVRGPSVIAIIRPSEEKVIWAARGSWRHQHYVRATDEGTIMIYDNDGGASIAKSSKGNLIFKQQPRIIEYNPVTNKSRVLFFNRSEKEMYSYWRGYHKKLDNNTMLVSSAETGRLVQVDKKGNFVWELRTIPDRNASIVPYTKKLPFVKYYDKSYTDFFDCTNCSDND